MRISDWSSDVCSSDLLQGAHLAGPAVDQVGWIQAAEQDDVLHALQDVVRHIGNGVRVGVDGNDGHEPRKPFGSKTRDCSFALPAESSLDAAVARSRAGLEQPANAETAAPAVLPAVSALPTKIGSAHV